MEVRVIKLIEEYLEEGVGTSFLKGIEELLIDEKVEGSILNTERDYPSCKFYEKMVLKY